MNLKKILAVSAAMSFGLMVSACSSDSDDSSKTIAAPESESSEAESSATETEAESSADTSEPVPASSANVSSCPAEEYTFEVSADFPITNPLQGKAMKYLDKSLSITNWLEETFKFTGEFQIDEQDVKLMSENGIKSLRFPIDLDIYSDWENYVAGVVDSLTIDDENLFMVLDSFNVWTKKYNMALDIDYHEYDNSFNKSTASDPRYVTMMAMLWKHVAAHFATECRNDLFFELLNEPDMTYGNVTSAVWHNDAKEIIDSIRTVDTFHTLIFGDARWYSIYYLSRSTPFDDNNIIYAVHTYEPFIFSHQGASWTDYADVHDIQFPYDSTTFTGNGEDYGVTSSSPSSVQSAFKKYPTTGTKEAVATSIMKAKDWAITNNVPVMINEFGAYRNVSDAQSVLNYMTVMREISDSLQIPLTHWGYTGGFALFETGEGVHGTKLIEGMKEAYGL